MRDFCEQPQLAFWEVDVPNCDRLYPDQLMPGTFIRYFFAKGFGDCLCVTSLQCLIFPPLPLKRTDPAQFLYPDNKQSSIRSSLFNICLSECSQSQSPDQKDPVQHCPRKRGNHCWVVSQVIFQPPRVVQLEQAWSKQQLHLPDAALHHTAHLSWRSLLGMFFPAPRHTAERQLPILTIQDWFQYRNLFINKVCVL